MARWAGMAALSALALLMGSALSAWPPAAKGWIGGDHGGAVPGGRFWARRVAGFLPGAQTGPNGPSKGAMRS